MWSHTYIFEKPNKTCEWNFVNGWEIYHFVLSFLFNYYCRNLKNQSEPSALRSDTSSLVSVFFINSFWLIFKHTKNNNTARIKRKSSEIRMFLRHLTFAFCKAFFVRQKITKKITTQITNDKLIIYSCSKNWLGTIQFLQINLNDLMLLLNNMMLRSRDLF